MPLNESAVKNSLPIQLSTASFTSHWNHIAVTKYKYGMCTMPYFDEYGAAWRVVASRGRVRDRGRFYGVVFSVETM